MKISETNCIGKVVKLEVKPHSRKVNDEKYLRRNAYYLVEDEKTDSNGTYYRRKKLIKLDGINGYRDSSLFTIIPDAIVREQRIENIFNRSKKEVITTKPLGVRGITTLINKEKIMLSLVFSELLRTKQGSNIDLDYVIKKIIAEDIAYCLIKEDFDFMINSSLNELTNIFSKS